MPGAPRGVRQVEGALRGMRRAADEGLAELQRLTAASSRALVALRQERDASGPAQRASAQPEGAPAPSSPE